jgi:V/A-type H+-transporting ATPase subunit I
MAIARMAKVLIITHRTQASGLLETLQREGICQILNTKDAAITKDWPEFAVTIQQPKDIETLLHRLEKSIAFLGSYSKAARGLAAVLSPRAVIDEQLYSKVVSDPQFLNIITQCELLEAAIEKTKGHIESLQTTLQTLYPWQSLETPVEEISGIQQAVCLTGLLPVRQFEQLEKKIAELGAAVEKKGATAGKVACLIVCLKEQTDQVQKLLRSADFEPVSFESMTGTIAELIERHSQELNKAQSQTQDQYDKAALLAEKLLDIKILHDHYENLLNREQTKNTAPATVHTVVLEGWVKKKDYGRLEKIIAGFDASSLTRIEPAEGEEIPVEIENKSVIKPFEVITRLYGMPMHFNVDPTVFLAPFFALFFGICIGDAGYGLTMIILSALLIRKMQGDKKLVWMLVICSVFAILVGILTGSWFGNLTEIFIPGIDGLRKKIMWFDPMENPMPLFAISMILGYIHIMTGLLIAFVHNLKQKDYIAALCDQLTWLIMLNSVVVLGLSKAGPVPSQIGRFFAFVAIVPAVTIVLFSTRQGSWGARIGMGVYNLFSSIFYLGDVLSYLRLMGLCMVGAGMAMAMNILAETLSKTPVVGIIIAIVILIVGHGFNLFLSILGAFVHTMRLQFVEFFPKFLVGGGKVFEPLSKTYQHIKITEPVQINVQDDK